jgi:hypothetical protein
MTDEETMSERETPNALIQATPGETAAFAPDRTARDGGGVFRPARLDPANGTDVQYLDPHGIIRDTVNPPLVIQRIERLPVPQRTDGGLELNWRVNVSTVTGQHSSLPAQVRRDSDLTCFAEITRLPREGHGDAVWDVALFIEQEHMQMTDGGRANPFAEVRSTLAHVFEFTSLATDDDSGPVPGHVWRAQARRFGLADPEDFADLHRFPLLDDALGKGFDDRHTGWTAVPLYRAANGTLNCVIGSRHDGINGYDGPPPELGARREDTLDEAGGDRRGVPALASAGYRLLAEARASALSAVAAAQQERDQAREQHQQDIDTIGGLLLSEAEDRSWCSEFDAFVEGANRRLHRELKPRRRDYLVEVRVTTVVTVRVEAKDEDGARDNVTSGEVRRQLREWDGSLDSDDWDIEDVSEAD